LVGKAHHFELQSLQLLRVLLRLFLAGFELADGAAAAQDGQEDDFTSQSAGLVGASAASASF